MHQRRGRKTHGRRRQPEDRTVSVGLKNGRVGSNCANNLAHRFKSMSEPEYPPNIEDNQPQQALPPKTPALLQIIVCFACVGYVYSFFMFIFYYFSKEIDFIHIVFFQHHHLQSRNSLLPILFLMPLGFVWIYGTLKRLQIGWLTLIFIDLSQVISNLVGIFQVFLWSVITPEIGYEYTDAGRDLRFFILRLVLPILFLIYYNSNGVIHYFNIDHSKIYKRMFQIFLLSAFLHILVLLTSPTVTRLPFE
ncbi:MAG: hypothetical protein P9L94_11000 [Candidatus Hinthialibacter antarcticus]|nr:hypothetical protein [Candidatus Hinthialibacter antarcticus]